MTSASTPASAAQTKEALEPVAEHRIEVRQQDEGNRGAVCCRQLEGLCSGVTPAKQRLVGRALHHRSIGDRIGEGYTELDDIGAACDQCLDQPVARRDVGMAAGEVGDQGRVRGVGRCERSAALATPDRQRTARRAPCSGPSTSPAFLCRRRRRPPWLRRPAQCCRAVGSLRAHPLSPRPDRLTITTSPEAKAGRLCPAPSRRNRCPGPAEHVRERVRALQRRNDALDLGQKPETRRAPRRRWPPRSGPAGVLQIGVLGADAG